MQTVREEKLQMSDLIESTAEREEREAVECCQISWADR